MFAGDSGGPLTAGNQVIGIVSWVSLIERYKEKISVFQNIKKFLRVMAAPDQIYQEYTLEYHITETGSIVMYEGIEWQNK